MKHTCRDCGGTGKQMGMGFIMEKCQPCEGIGYVAKDAKVEVNGQENHIQSAKNVKRKANVDSSQA